MQTPRLRTIITVALAILLVTGCSKQAQEARLLHDADTYFKAGNYDKAKVTYLNVLRLDPQSALAFERIGAMWQDDAAPLADVPWVGPVLGFLAVHLLDIAAGAVVGAVALAVVTVVRRLFRRREPAAAARPE